jgi:hypothetical protein
LQVQFKIVSQLPRDWRAGDDEALRALIYDELRRVDRLAFKSGSGMVVHGDALNESAKLDQLPSRIAERRFFDGLPVEETSGLLNTSPLQPSPCASRVFSHSRQMQRLAAP